MKTSLLVSDARTTQRNKAEAMESVRVEIAKMLKSLSNKSREKLIAARRKKFLDMGSKSLA